jgi:hypothetical protein
MRSPEATLECNRTHSGGNSIMHAMLCIPSSSQGQQSNASAAVLVLYG